jgi:hypothetical protein
MRVAADIVKLFICYVFGIDTEQDVFLDRS